MSTSRRDPEPESLADYIRSHPWPKGGKSIIHQGRVYSTYGSGFFAQDQDTNVHFSCLLGVVTFTIDDGSVETTVISDMCPPNVEAFLLRLYREAWDLRYVDPQKQAEMSDKAFHLLGRLQ